MGSNAFGFWLLTLRPLQLAFRHFRFQNIYIRAQGITNYYWSRGSHSLLGGHLNWSKALSACSRALPTGSKTLWLALRPLLNCHMFESPYVQLQKTDGRNFSPC